MMGMNKPWKSKEAMVKLCAGIGAQLKTERETDPNGKRVFPLMFDGKLYGFSSMRSVYVWLVQKLKHSSRP
jgi:hypothetical protein